MYGLIFALKLTYKESDSVEFFTPKDKVYIRADQQNRVTDIDSSAFLADVTGWIEIDEGHGDIYRHAQNNYLPGPVYDECGCHNFWYTPGQTPPYTQRSAKDKQEEASAVLGASIRAERDRLLSACDYIMMPDYPADETVKTAWAAYRQALRDVPEQEGFPNNVMWPISANG